MKNESSKFELFFRNQKEEELNFKIPFLIGIFFIKKKFVIEDFNHKNLSSFSQLNLLTY